MTSRVSKVVQHLRRTVLRQEGAGLSDGQLLGCFIEQRDEAAFAALVRRHGPLVWGVCRRLLNHHDAEDAFQAAFLVLFRKAASIRPREMLANWLYGVAHRAALQARRNTARRRARERQVTEMPEPAVAAGQDLWDDLRPLLDQELSRLPDQFRVALILCDLEGKTRREAARQLGLPEGTLASRLARARQVLAKRLARHGLAVSGGALGVVLAHKVASAGVPTSVVSSTIKAASLVAAGPIAVAGVIPVKVAALMEGVMKAMLLSKLKTITAALLLLAAVGIGGGLLSRSATVTADERLPRKGPGQARQARTRSLVVEINPGVNSDTGVTGSVVLNERNFDTNLVVNKDYKAIFIKTLGVMAEHFTQITYANQYDGRMEACTVAVDATGLMREAAVMLWSTDGKGLPGEWFLTVCVHKVRRTGDKSEVVGRDAELERVILTKLNARPVAGEMPPQVGTSASHPKRDEPNGEPYRGLSTPNSPRPFKGEGGAEPKKSEPKTEQEGSSLLKGAWRVQSVTGGEGAFAAFRHMDLIFVGERLVVVPNDPKDNGPAGVYLFHLGAKRPMQEIDFHQKGAVGETRVLGVYEVQGETLRLCVSSQLGTRATRLEPGTRQALLVARRVHWDSKGVDNGTPSDKLTR